MPKLNTSTITNAMYGGTQLAAVYKGTVPIWIAGGAMPTISSISSNGWWRNSGYSGGCVAGNRLFNGECGYNFTSDSPDTAEVYWEYYDYGAWQNRYSGWTDAGRAKNMDGVCTGYDYSATSGRTLCSSNGSKPFLNMANIIRIKIRDENGETDFTSTYTDEELAAFDAWVIETYGTWEDFYEAAPFANGEIPKEIFNGRQSN